jgi:tetratricopeptide (TPR) repeat protein
MSSEAWEAVDDKDDPQTSGTERLTRWQQAAAQHHEPSPWIQAIVKARRCETVFDWAGAEAAYQQGTALAADQPMKRYGAYRQLSAFYRLHDRYELALEAAQRATAAPRRVNSPTTVVIALHVEATICSHRGDEVTAWDAVKEAFEIIGIGQGSTRASLLTMRARCFLEQGGYTAALADLQDAWKLAAPQADDFDAIGWQSEIAAWCATSARLWAKQGDAVGAVAAWQGAVARRRLIAGRSAPTDPYPHNELAIALRHLGRALREIGVPAAAASFAESRTIRRAIGLPPLEG